MADSSWAQIVTGSAVGAGSVRRYGRAQSSVAAARKRGRWTHEVQFLRAGTPNLLLIGSGAVAEEFLVPWMPSLASPIVYLETANPALPTTPVGTLIVRDVARLTPAQQAEFLEWLNAQTDTVVIAISARSLFPRVCRGVFSDALYYRLNTVVVELTRG